MAEKKHPPSERKLRKARQEGRVPRSPHAAGTAVLLVVLAAGAYIAPSAWQRLAALARVCLGGAPTAGAAARLAGDVGWLVALLLVAGMTAGGLCSLLISGPLLAPGALAPKLGHLNLVRNLRARLASQQALVELLRMFVSAIGVGLICAAVLRDQAATLPRTTAATPSALAAITGELVRRLGISAAVLYTLLAALDVAYRRWRYRQELRMTDAEYKREIRDNLGDPYVRAARRRMYAEMSRRRAIARVATEADVVVRNPTHLACALRYDPDAEGRPPVLVAKGAGWMAEAMLEVARRTRVPVVQDIPLARALYRLEPEMPIPPELYDATVAVLRWAVELCAREGRRPPWERRRHKRPRG